MYKGRLPMMTMLADDWLDISVDDNVLVEELLMMVRIVERALVVGLNVVVELNSFHVLRNRFWIFFERVLVSWLDSHLRDVSFPK